MSSQLHSLTHFSDISALTGGTAHLDEVRVGTVVAGAVMLLATRGLRTASSGESAGS